jgi:hypothetical protein
VLIAIAVAFVFALLGISIGILGGLI